MWSIDVAYNLAHEMTRLQQDINRLFGDTLYTGDRRTFPPMNVWANDESAIVTCELPGFDPKAIDITVQDNVLYLSGKRDAEKMGDNLKSHRRERSMGEFNRSMNLPFQVDQNKVEAEFERGTLRIKLPRAEQDKPKKIEIKG